MLELGDVRASELHFGSPEAVQLSLATASNLAALLTEATAVILHLRQP